jgi:hypothetical protein
LYAYRVFRMGNPGTPHEMYQNNLEKQETKDIISCNPQE